MTKEGNNLGGDVYDRTKKGISGHSRNDSESRAEVSPVIPSNPASRALPTPPKPAGAGTETARTDDAICRFPRDRTMLMNLVPFGYVVPVDFARQLERECRVFQMECQELLDKLLKAEAELTSLRRQAEADRATIKELKAALLDAREAKNRYKSAANTLAQEHLSETEALHAQLASADKDRERLSWMASDSRTLDEIVHLQSIISLKGEYFFDALDRLIAMQSSASLQPPIDTKGATVTEIASFEIPDTEIK